MAGPEDPKEQLKVNAGARAVDFVEDGMRLGLGTGSTAAWFVKALAERVRDEGWTVTCVPTSERTHALAAGLGLDLTTLDKIGWLDLTVDGADEFDGELNLIKGGGGALLREKIVATASDRMIVIADDEKQVARLGAFPLPVEVVRFGWETTRAIIEDTLTEAGIAEPKMMLRMDGDAPFDTDEGHLILDLHLGAIENPRVLALLLNQIPGVVEHGLFIDVADMVIVGDSDGETKIIGGEMPDLV
jgi:ribose 5-phosphate isomerase A